MKKSKKKSFIKLNVLIGIVMCKTTLCFAATGGKDPNALIGNLFDLIASIISAVGAIIILWGAVTLGLGIQKHDPASKSEGTLSIVGGIVIATAPWIVKQII